MLLIYCLAKAVNIYGTGEQTPRMPKQANKRNKKVVAPARSEYNHNSNAEFDRCSISRSVRIIPRNINQEEYLEYLTDDKKVIVIATGPAGVGKTQIAMSAGIKALQEKKINKLILTRPIVTVKGEEALGALPGDLIEKMNPYTQPLFDVLSQYYKKRDIEAMLESGVIEVAPLSFVRGRNFSNTWVILDEAQNTTISQCKAIMTRLCDNAKLVITGDNSQSDRRDSENGLLFFTEALKQTNSDYIATVNFGYKDVQRHPVVSDVLDIFENGGF